MAAPPAGWMLPFVMGDAAEFGDDALGGFPDFLRLLLTEDPPAGGVHKVAGGEQQRCARSAHARSW